MGQNIFKSVPEFCFVLTITDELGVCHWSGFISNETCLKKPIFSFASGYLQATSGLLMKDCVHFHFGTGSLSGQVLCRSCSCCCSLYEFVCKLILLCLEGLISSEFSVRSLTISLPPFLRDSQSTEGGFDRDTPFRTGYFIISHSLHMFHLCVSVCVPIYCRRH